MKRSDLAFSLAVGLAAMAASNISQAAASDTCDGFGAATFAPAHPIATDLIGVQVKSWTNPPPVGTPTMTTLSHIQVLPGDAIYVEVIVTAHPEKYPGYRKVDAPYDESFGLVGPLPVGDHPITSAIYYEDAQGVITKPCGGPFVSVLTIGQTPTLTVRAPVIEFYNASLDHYFMTQDAVEIAALDNGTHPGWVRTGESFLAFVAGKSDNLGRPVCRYYSPSPLTSSHSYSASAAECLALAGFAEVWTLESSDVFEVGLPDHTSGVCTLGQAPLYRLSWQTRVDHKLRYTSSASTREQMMAKGWSSVGFGPEGVAMCTPVR